jgi:enamine deaminase RidA (YjgF/YER057c/UK114 family)
MTIQRIQAGKRMSQAVIHGDTVYLAGQVALDKPGGTVSEQTRNILDRIDALLKEAGSDKAKLLSATIWLADMRGFEEMNAVWDAWVAAGGRCSGPGHGRGEAGHAGLHGRDRHRRGAIAAGCASPSWERG